jgi:hypothetical protein
MNNSSAKPRGLLDIAAIGLSGLCLLHCLALPIIVAGLPFLAGLGDEHFHAEMLWIVLPLSTLALALGYRRHRSLLVWQTGIPGMLLLVIGGTIAHSMYGVVADRALTLLGALVLATAHYMNSRLASCAATEPGHAA